MEGSNTDGTSFLSDAGGRGMQILLRAQSHQKPGLQASLTRDGLDGTVSGQ